MGMIIDPYRFEFTPPATSYANPGGTGNRTGSITVSAIGGQSFGGGASGAGLVNGTKANNTTDAAYWNATSGVTNGLITFDFGSGVQKYIDEIKWFQNTSSANGTYVFEGSNDNSSYTVLGSSFTLNDAGSGSTFATTHSVPALYRYYRLRQTGGSSAGQPWFQEIEFKIG